MVRRIVIIGGGPAGVQTYLQLHTQLSKSQSSEYTITLVSASDAMYINIASPRAIADPSIPATKLMRPLQQMFTDAQGKDIANVGKVTARLVIAKVTEVSDTFVRTEGSANTATDAVIEYDYLVVALGSRYAAPFKSLDGAGSVTSDAVTAIATSVADPKTASVLVLGAGIVAVETAAEIKAAYPAKTVTLAGPKILTTAPAAFTARVRSVLAKLDVKVIEDVTADTHAILVAADTLAFPIAKPGTEVSLRPTAGAPSNTPKSVTADFVFAATGVHPNSEPFKATIAVGTDAGWPLTSRGYLRVTDTLQVVGRDNVFAIGDIAEVEPLSPFAGKFGFIASQHAAVAAKNLAALLESRPIKDHWKPPTDFMCFAALGPKYGVAYMPGLKMGLGLTNLMAKKFKGKDGGLALIKYLPQEAK